MKNLLLCDTRGKQSTTLTFVTISWAAITIKFCLASFTVMGAVMPAMTATEYGAAAAAVLAIWLGREWKAKELANANL